MTLRAASFPPRSSTAATPIPTVRLSLVSGTCVSLRSAISPVGAVRRQASSANVPNQRFRMVSSKRTQPPATMIRRPFGEQVISTSTASSDGAALGPLGRVEAAGGHAYQFDRRVPDQVDRRPFAATGVCLRQHDAPIGVIADGKHPDGVGARPQQARVNDRFPCAVGRDGRAGDVRRNEVPGDVDGAQQHLRRCHVQVRSPFR